MRTLVMFLTLPVVVGCPAPASGPTTSLDGGLPAGVTGNGGALPAGTAASSTGQGTAPTDAVSFSGGFTSGASGVASFSVGGKSRAVTLVLPPTAATAPGLLIAFHGTGGTPAGLFDEARLQEAAASAGLVLAAPQALERNGGRGERGDPDHYEGSEGWGTSWNLADPNVDSNDDLLLVRAIVQSARAKLNVDSDRVYVLGHSNGGFFAWFVAASLPDRVAAFAENAAGAVRCAHRAAAGAQFTGTASTCAALQAQPGFPTCAGALLPAPVPTRVPPGYLAHAVDDALVSVAWTCTLAGALGNRAWVHLQVPTPPDTFGHAVTDDFAVGAITFMTRYRRQD